VAEPSRRRQDRGRSSASPDNEGLCDFFIFLASCHVIDRLEHGPSGFPPPTSRKPFQAVRNVRSAFPARTNWSPTTSPNFSIKKGADHSSMPPHRFQTITDRFAGFQRNEQCSRELSACMQRLAGPITSGGSAIPGSKVQDPGRHPTSRSFLLQ